MISFICFPISNTVKQGFFCEILNIVPINTVLCYQSIH